MEKRIRLKISYDGTAYHGWQIQDGAVTVEGVLTEAVSEAVGSPVELIGASRTDAGVHALGNVAVFDADTPIPSDKMAMVLNKLLPDDISIVCSDEVPSDWHPRKQDCRKTYEYRIYTSPVRMPLKRLYAHYTYNDLDIGEMDRAAAYFTGEHDFTAFCAAGSQAVTFTRTIYACSVKKDGNEAVISVTGSGFLYNMVRIIAGTLFEVGLGRKKADDIPGIIDSLDRRKAGPTLPACGLTLIGYEYEDHPF
ncbi:MAG: tRNA pseudouridine(38-40) synthase TruA [Lachnospiraceae bacterium]|nr:tRNA pseudouridine(38-40) synthase TruA [Lachnospiraceae bacterium]MBO7362938.1 tRNA pseudouridine(38-40) synthase TruA [Lachnospiraceae bacterium]MBP5252425.1 tRNA pseudouridine(38-40) synthase TruA [Lachnospiraceae bacterium]